jgi:hypothetical protein
MNKRTAKKLWNILREQFTQPLDAIVFKVMERADPANPDRIFGVEGLLPNGPGFTKMRLELEKRRIVTWWWGEIPKGLKRLVYMVNWEGVKDTLGDEFADGVKHTPKAPTYTEPEVDHERTNMYGPQRGPLAKPKPTRRLVADWVSSFFSGRDETV